MAARRRSKETVRTELERTRTRLDLYLAREQEMLSKDGVQLYTIGSRNLQRYQTPLTARRADCPASSASSSLIRFLSLSISS